MRAYGAFALVFVAGCSLVWDMDPYDTNTNANDATSANDGGASSSGASTSSGATTSTSSGGSSSGGSSGETLGDGDASTFEAGTVPVTDAGSDASTAPPTCTFEVEPNDFDSQAEEITTAKKTCGKVGPGDTHDYLFIYTAIPELIAIEFGPYVRLDVTYGDDTTKGSSTPGGYYVTLKPGENTMKFTSTGPSMGAYAIYRQ